MKATGIVSLFCLILAALLFNGCQKLINFAGWLNPKQPDYYSMPCDFMYNNNSSHTVSISLTPSSGDEELILSPGETGIYTTNLPCPETFGTIVYVSGKLFITVDNEYEGLWHRPTLYEPGPSRIKTSEKLCPIYLENYERLNTTAKDRLLYKFEIEEEICEAIIEYRKTLN